MYLYLWWERKGGRDEQMASATARDRPYMSDEATRHVISRGDPLWSHWVLFLRNLAYNTIKGQNFSNGKAGARGGIHASSDEHTHF